MNDVSTALNNKANNGLTVSNVMTKTLYQRMISRTDAQSLLDAIPDFQRKFEKNRKFEEVKAYTALHSEIPGEITVGILLGRPVPLDGQHRLHAFLETQLQDVKASFVEFSNGTYQDYAREFTMRNSQIRTLASDDRLRGMAPNLPLIKRLVEDFPFLNFTTAKNKDILSVSTVLSVWHKSSHGAPSGARAVADLANEMNEEEYSRLASFMRCAAKAWGEPDRTNKTMWSSLTLTLAAWLFRNIVHPKEPSRRITKIDETTFYKCLMGLASDATYSDWAVGRRIGRRDRGPTYNRIKEIFAARIRYEHPDKYPVGITVNLPQPRWSKGVDNVKGRA